MKKLLPILLVLFYFIVVKVSPVHALPEGFSDTLVAEISAPTDLEWTPDGRILVPDKGGRLWVIQNGVVLSTPAIDLGPIMCTNGERALGGVAVHPNFEINNYIYLYYTFNKTGNCSELSDSNAEGPGPVNRFSRFTLPPSNVIDPASEVVLFDTAPLFRDHHNGGDILFGTDGLIYVTVGDGGSQRFDWPQDPGRLLGKVVRVTDTGDIPPDNPYTGADSARCNLDGVPPAGSTATKCQEVFSIGLRNPFRMALDTNATTTRFYINDVGQHTWEDISEGPVNGGNYGWPIYEGPCLLDSTTDCDPQPDLIDPVHWDPHGVDGAAITGGAFVPNGVWPAAYDGTYLYADYVFGMIYHLTPGAAGCRLCDPPTSNFNKTDFAIAENIVAMAFGPYEDTQALYYVTRGFGPDETDGLRRITFTGDLNRSPTAVISADPTSGTPPLEVQFSGLGSSDPDGDPLTYAWDFEDDGLIDSVAPSTSHIYTVAGTYFAKLTVDDGQGGQHTASQRIDVGNTAPVPVIETPAEGTTFAVGDVFTLHGSATDAEDGTLADTALIWEVRQHHATHFHPFLDETPGNDIVLQPAPEPEDLTAATNSFLEVRLTATDSTGLSTTVSRFIQPRKVNLSFDTSPSGLNLVLDGSTVTTPITVVSWEAHNLEAQAPNQTQSGTSYEWLSWSDGGAQTHFISVPSSPASYVATFGGTAPSFLTFSPSDDATIRDDRPDRNLGAEPILEVDGSPNKNTMLRFDISGIGSASVESAILRLYVNDSSSFGGEFFVTDPNWSEDTLTWNNAPPVIGSSIGSLGDIDVGLWYEVDVTSLVTGDNPISLRITSPASNGADYSSKEGAAGFAPELIVTLNQPTTPSETPTDTPTNTPTNTPTDTPIPTITSTPTNTPDVSETPTNTPTNTPTDTPTDTPTNTPTDTSTDTPTNTPTNTPTLPSTSTVTLLAAADSYVHGSSVNNNYGSSTALRTDASPEMRSYLRFDVPPLTGSVSSATVRVFAATKSSQGYTLFTTDSGWTENGITFSNAPAAGTALGSSGPIDSNTWTTIDVTSLVNGAGSYNVVMISFDTTATRFSSREGSNPPELIINVVNEPVITNTPTDTPTNTPTFTPTDTPTNTATFTPTNTPTDTLTPTVTFTPTDTPEVSDTPTNTPTDTPTDTPTNTPTDTPTNTPTDTPTNTPTDTPTDTPTNTPTDTPTNTPTDTPTNTPSGEPQTLTLYPAADTYVYELSPTRNYGTSIVLRTDGSPLMHSYLRFNVPTLNGSVVSATLRMYAETTSDLGYNVHSASSGWDEYSITYQTAPSFGSVVSMSGSGSAGSWLEANVLSLVTGAGEVNFALTTNDTTATRYSSREGANPPELVIVVNSTFQSTSSSLQNEPVSGFGSLETIIQPTNTVTPTNTPTDLPTATDLPTNTPTDVPTATDPPATSTPTAVEPTSTFTSVPTATEVPPTIAPPSTNTPVPETTAEVTPALNP